MPNHGGYRPGAGRKPAPPSVKIWVRVSPEMAGEIEQWRVSHQLTQRSEAVRQMIDDAACRLRQRKTKG